MDTNKVVVWEKEGWTLEKKVDYVLKYEGAPKLAITAEAFRLYEIAFRICPLFAELVSIGVPIMRVAK
jgi:hypothetical protein